MRLAELTISLTGSILLFVALLLLAVLAAALFYRYTLPPLPPRWRIMLSSLRALALIVLLLTLFEPLLQLINRSEQRPAIALLVDNSQSMTITDGKIDRATSIRSFLKEHGSTIASRGTDVQQFAFAQALVPIASSLMYDSLPFDGEATNISEALKALKDRVSNDNIQAVILLSDGNYTEGRNPIYDAENLGVPVFTVGVGDTTEQKDILISKVLTNSIAYAESDVPVDVTVRSSGYDGEKVELTLADGAAVIDRRVLTLQQGTHEYTARFVFHPTEDGVHRYTVNVSHLPGELTERNNRESFFVKVLKSKLRVLVLAGAPSPDVAALRGAIQQDERFDVRTMVQRSPGAFYEGAYSRTLIDTADALVMIGFPSAATTIDVLQDIRAAIDQKRTPLFFVNGSSVDYAKLQQLEAFLPFGWNTILRTEVLVLPHVPERQKNHLLVNLGDGGRAAGAALWQRLPPIYKSQTTFHAKPGTEVVIQPTLQQVTLDEPLVVARSLNRQKVVAVTGYGLWRWRLLAQSGSDGSSVVDQDALTTFVSTTIRWLTTKEDDQRVRVTPVKEAFTTAEPVEFTGQVYDDELRPADNAALSVELSTGGIGAQNIQLVLRNIGGGRYEGAIDALPEGEYRYTAKAISAENDARSFGEDKGKFSVGQSNVEFQTTKMNRALLEQIAERTGGSYRALNEADQLADDLSLHHAFTPKELVQTSEIELWNWRYTAIFLVLLLSTEWFLRKRNGML
jgi:Mg-chelatase subunit ChlD